MLISIRKLFPLVFVASTKWDNSIIKTGEIKHYKQFSLLSWGNRSKFSGITWDWNRLRTKITKDRQYFGSIAIKKDDLKNRNIVELLSLTSTVVCLTQSRRKYSTSPTTYIQAAAVAARLCFLSHIWNVNISMTNVNVLSDSGHIWVWLHPVE